MTHIREIMTDNLMKETIQKFSSRRWFFLRPEDILSANILTAYPEDVEDGDSLIMVLSLKTEEGEKLMDLALTLHQDTYGDYHFTDSIEDGHFPDVLKKMIHEDGDFKITEHGVGLKHWVESNPDFKPMKLEQSNSSFKLGDSVIGKFFRTPSGPENPDYQIPILIRKYSDFKGVPENLGAIMYNGKRDLCICVFSTFIKNMGDYWKYLFERSRETDNSNFLIEAREEAVKIGVAVAKLHISLASIDEKGYTRENFTERDYLRIKKQDNGLIQEFKRILKSSYGVSYRDLYEMEGRFITPEFHKIGEKKQPIHGDLHLGQILKTEETPVIIDFEGEPMAAMEDRVSKGSILKDLAGLTRSWNYLWHFILGNGDLPDKISAEFREITVDTYMKEMEKAGMELGNQWNDILSFFEIEKAIYEAVYEWNNRPEMLWIPMQFLRNSLKCHS